MSDGIETLHKVGSGIVGRRPLPVRVRVGAAVFARVYKGLCESEYEYKNADGETVLMWMRWTKATLNVPHYLVYGRPVELDPALGAEEIIYDGQEAM